jgi:hypothetical protein
MRAFQAMRERAAVKRACCRLRARWMPLANRRRRFAGLFAGKLIVVDGRHLQLDINAIE